MLLVDYLKEKKDFLKENHVIDYAISAEEIFSKILNIKKNDLYLYHERILSQKEIQKLDELVQKRNDKIPLGYLISPITFYGCVFHLNEHVLIPRHETEILVDKITSILKKEENLEKKVFLDLCTGSGCIAISIKKQFSHLKVIASDISYQALEVAKKNALINKVEIDFVQGDGLSPFQNQKFDYVASNPPYVSEEEYTTLSQEVKNEPKIALVSGKTGLEFYQMLALDMPLYLNEHAKIFLEMGYMQSGKLKKIFSNNYYCQQNILEDFSHRERFFFMEFALPNKIKR